VAEAALHVEDMAGYPGQLAVGLMAALRGGCLLANTAHDVRPMEIAPDLALGHVRSCLTEPWRGRRRTDLWPSPPGITFTQVIMRKTCACWYAVMMACALCRMSRSEMAQPKAPSSGEVAVLICCTAAFRVGPD
jgi:hypothetical protein